MNILRALSTVPALLRDAKLLESDVAGATHDPEIVKELEGAPKLKARLEKISAEWRQVEKDVDAIRK